MIEERMKNDVNLTENNYLIITKIKERVRNIEKKHSETIDLLQKEFRDKFESAHKVYDSTKQTVL